MALTDMTTSGERIRFLRVAAGLSQESLAKKVYATQVAVSYWERNLRTPSRATQMLLAEALGTSRLFLFGEAAA